MVCGTDLTKCAEEVSLLGWYEEQRELFFIVLNIIQVNSNIDINEVFI